MIWGRDAGANVSLSPAGAGGEAVAGSGSRSGSGLPSPSAATGAGVGADSTAIPGPGVAASDGPSALVSVAVGPAPFDVVPLTAVTVAVELVDASPDAGAVGDDSGGGNGGTISCSRSLPLAVGLLPGDLGFSLCDLRSFRPVWPSSSL